MALSIVGIGSLLIGTILIILSLASDLLHQIQWSRRYSGFLIVLGITMITCSTLVSNTQNDNLIALAAAVDQGNGMKVLELIRANQYLLNEDVSGIGNGEPLLHRAIDSGKLAIMVMTLANENPNLEIHDSKGRTPLIHALQKQSLFMVTILLNRGASPNVQSPDGRNTWQLAEEAGSDFTQAFAHHVPETYRKWTQLSKNASDTQSSRITHKTP